MQPINPTLSDLYAHHRHNEAAQYYSHFPSQNPNPYPIHQHRHLQIDPQFSSASIHPDPPGTDAYLSSYAINPAGVTYHTHHDSGLTYPHTIGTVPPPTYASQPLVQNWVTEESVQSYGNTLYAAGSTVLQDGSQHLVPAIPTHTQWMNQTVKPRGPWKKLPKKTKIAQSAWCEICKIECNTNDVLLKHKLGRKHLKNLEKLNSGASVGATHMNPAAASNPIIGPAQNPANSVPKKKKIETPADLEIKRRKVLEGGAAVNAVRTCEVCNVVCNSDAVFRFHLAGQKHTSMMQKLHEGGRV